MNGLPNHCRDRWPGVCFDPVTAAVGIGAGTSLVGGALSANAAQSAADTQAAAANQASQNALAQYQQTRTDLAPYRTAGNNALNVLSSLYGLNSATTGAIPTIPGLPAGWGGSQGSDGRTTVYDQNGGVVGTYSPSELSQDISSHAFDWMVQPGGPRAGGAPSGSASAAPGASASGTLAVNPNLASATGATPSGAGSLPQGWTLNYMSPSEATESGGNGGSPGGYRLQDADGNVIGTYPTQADALALFGRGGQGQGGAALPASGPPAAVSGGNPLAYYGLPGLTFQPTQAQLEATPGYQFDLSQGLLGVANSNAAKGLGISGAALKGAASYATGLANNTLLTQQGIFQQNLANILGPLQWAANLGQNSAATTGQQGIQAVGNANQLAVGGANALAAGQVGSANALASGLGGLGNSATNYLLYSQLGNNGGGGYVDSGTFG